MGRLPGLPRGKVGTWLSHHTLLKTSIPTRTVHTPMSLVQAASRIQNTLAYSHLLPPTTPTWLIPIHLSRLCTRMASLRNVSKAMECSKRRRCNHHRLSQQTTWAQVLALLLTVPSPCCVTLGKFKLRHNRHITLRMFKVYTNVGLVCLYIAV